MHLTEIRTLDELEALRPRWRELADAAAHDTPYVLPEFMLPWLRRMRGRCACRFLAAWEGDTLVGLAPMVERRIARLGLEALSLLGFPDAPPTPPCDILVREGCDTVVEAFCAHWDLHGGWDAIVLPAVPAESAVAAQLERAAVARAWTFEAEPALETYYVRIATSWEVFHAGRSHNLRRTLSRGLRHLQSLGQPRFELYPGAMSRERAWDATFRVLGQSWKDHEAGPEGWNAFLRDMVAELCASGLIEIAVLWLDERPVAYVIEVPVKGVRYAVHGAYDLAYQRANPGQLMLARALEAAHRRGDSRYDFTGHNDYLRRWSETTRSFRQLRIRPRSPLARLKLAAYDWVHARRVREVHAGTDNIKDTRKREVRVTRDELDE